MRLPFRVSLLLPILVVIAAALRFTGLSWGLRHTPQIDEFYFVQNVGWMLDAGDWNHRFHEYPGLFFYILAPVLAFFHPPDMRADAYLAARSVVALFGVASVGLVYRLGDRMAGPVVGLVAAAIVAVSPLEVFTAHMVRPDVVLETFVLAAFLAFARVGPEARADGLSGVAVGAATAIKFSGLLVAPSYVAQRLLAPGFRWKRLFLAGAVSVVAYALLSPYTLLDIEGALKGARTQVEYHYAEGVERKPYWLMVGTYGIVLLKALGWPGILLVVLGLFLCAREWRRWLPLAILPVVLIGVFSTAEVDHDRFMVPTFGVVALFAGRGVDGIARRSRPGALAVVLLAVAPLLSSSVRYVAEVSLPGTRDVALDWIEANLPPGSRVLTTLAADLGVDRSRYEVIRVDRLDQKTWRQALHMDLIAAGPADMRTVVRELQPVYIAEPSSRPSGARIRLLVPPAQLRLAYQVVPLDRARLSASESPELLPAIGDGNLTTVWRTRGDQAPGQWIQADFPRPFVVGRLELSLGVRPRHYPRTLHVFVTADGKGWRRVPFLPGRPPVDDQAAGRLGSSDVLLLDPVRTRGIRIVQMGRRGKPWSVAELRVDALAEPGV